jgi:hypothetical protein
VAEEVDILVALRHRVREAAEAAAKPWGLLGRIPLVLLDLRGTREVILQTIKLHQAVVVGE